MTVRRFRVEGIVQGVGFRPFVYRTASTLGLDGWVARVNGHVEGKVAGPQHVIDEFAVRLRADALARVRSVRLTGETAPPAYRPGFQVRHSGPYGGRTRRPARSRPTPPSARPAWPNCAPPATAATATPSSTARTAGRGPRSSRICRTT
ncbi:acylphosphatase [Streptomyces sp. NPDC048419]|uniref:acylphosphatase n=1 Tax=Streptomyces sp. NPDC048419 TaxID=3365547 RepID=UPI003716EEA5